jgi:threonine synthase
MGDEAVLAAIAETHERTGRLVDPHTAIGLAIGRMRAAHPGAPLVAVATADPAKFPDAVEAATGIRPPLPDDLADLFDRPERFERIEPDPAVLADRL